ncbi:MAG: transporter [Microscillaceae bacterium]|nr:transporter [Microscillaceae bacterium]
MSDIEFDVLDELYFVQTFDYLAGVLEMAVPELVGALRGLYEKGWVKCLDLQKDEPISPEQLDWEKGFAQYRFLATKAGLMAHNGRG